MNVGYKMAKECNHGDFYAQDDLVSYCASCGQTEEVIIIERLLINISELREAIIRLKMWPPKSTEAACEQDLKNADQILEKTKDLHALCSI